MGEVEGVSLAGIAGQIRKLEDAGYIKVEKMFVDRKPKTFCKITGKGRKSVRNLITSLENLVNLD
ncbi:MAG TPA: hypothetical protein ENH94_02750 [Phycisphaerales bacterium]|nr:hypothetical protein [Phycisphaerales bacterium]